MTSDGQSTIPERKKIIRNDYFSKNMTYFFSKRPKNHSKMLRFIGGLEIKSGFLRENLCFGKQLISFEANFRNKKLKFLRKSVIQIK